MTPFEQELKKALERRQPSDDFAERLLRKVAEPASRRSVWLWPGPLLRLSASLVLFVLLAGGVAYRQHVRMQHGQAAKRQLLVALKIAAVELRQTQTRVWHVENSRRVVIQ